MNIDEKMLAMLIAELKASQGQALAILTQAICQQIDPARLTSDLRQQIEAAKQMRGVSPVSIQIVTEALAAAEAEKMLQARPASEGPHPKRE